MIARALKLSPEGSETFFLWGPRQTGKSTLLRSAYPDAVRVDLLQSDVYRRYLERPELLRLELADSRPFVIVDEVQKVPALLDEVHWLHENMGMNFALCGSSARKLKRGQANLLGGRAISYRLFGFTSAELGREWNLERMLNHGYLPRMYLAERPMRLLRSYVADYLKEEVAAEGLVRKLPVFSEFLNIAALSDCELVNYSMIARECGVSSQTIKGYFDILVDTLIGSWLPAWRECPKRRVIGGPKFYFFDVGVVNFLARRGKLEPGCELFGKAFENWVHHELVAYNSYSETYAPLAYWRLPSGIEVDFVLGAMEVAIEAKGSRKVTADHLKGLRHLQRDFPEVRHRIVVSLEPKRWVTPDGIEVLPAHEFSRPLWAGELF